MEPVKRRSEPSLKSSGQSRLRCRGIDSSDTIGLKRKATKNVSSKQTKRSRLQDEENEVGKCLFCGDFKESEDYCGSMKHDVESGITAHQFCLYFSSNLSQVGDKNDNLGGFRPTDITAEYRRGLKLRCSYCRKSGATVGCSEVSCKKSYHFSCGRIYGAFNEFFGSFRSFCKNHAPNKEDNVPQKFRDKALSCGICFEDINLQHPRTAIFPECCENGGFHSTCIQEYALSAGAYHFRCPLCMNKDFKKIVLNSGIYIPVRDAQWELDGDFNDVLPNQVVKCSAPTCICPNGETHHSDHENKIGKWTLVPCSYCGSVAMHGFCSLQSQSGRFMMFRGKQAWKCGDCNV